MRRNLNPAPRSTRCYFRIEDSWGVLLQMGQFGRVTFLMAPKLFKQVLPLLLMFFAFSGAPGWAQSKVNFKVIPILQPMKEVAPTPEFSLATPEGKKVSLKDFRGKTVFLNFWATWCAPCREEMPAMEKLYQEYKNKNFVVLAVNVKDRKQEALNFVKELKLTYPVAFDPEAQVAALYGAWGLPTTYLIGPKGEGLARGWGPAEWYSPAARKMFKELLEETNGRR
jgi:thiol-disulfide isomerase/thioredoxin